MLQEIRRRLLSYVIIFLVVWPIFSVVSAAIEARSLPYYTPTRIGAVLWAGAGGMVLLPDFLFCGSLLLVISLFIFLPLAVKRSFRFAERWWGVVLEPVLFCWVVLVGATLYYPTLLNHPVLLPLHSLPVWGATAILGIIVSWGACIMVKPEARLRMWLTVVGVALLGPLPVSQYGIHGQPVGTEPPTVLLGLDSLSHADDLGQLKMWTAHQGGTWYSHAVPPGLVTNAVWSSILTMLPIHDHGVFHTFQSFPGKSKATLLERARQAGYQTVSVFPDQLTSWVGSQAGFDDDRSGPFGWRHLVAFYVENASVILPLVRPLFPQLPFSDVRPNHSGMFTYSVERELHEIFSASVPGAHTFVAAHLTYLHTPCFPPYLELSWKERLRVLGVGVRSVRDRSFDWQDKDLPTDAFPLREWKVQRLLKAVSRAVDEHRFLKRGGKLVLFSDHGDRAGLRMNNFWQERYHRVLLVTFGLPARDPNKAISLLDIGSLLGLVPQLTPADPVVEYALAEGSEWGSLVRSSRVYWDGSIKLDEQILNPLFQQLLSYRPWSPGTLPNISPVFVSSERVKP